MTEPQQPTPLLIWTDGACKGNPGDGGWGALLQWKGHTLELFNGARETTNNKMELQAVISALRVVNRPVPIVIHTDSNYVKDGITKWIHAWKRNRWLTAAKKPVKNVELWQALDDLVSRHEITWVWVKGHDGDPGNEKADELANRGVEVARGKLDPPALARC